MSSFCRSLNRRSQAGVGLAALALAIGFSLAPAARAQDNQDNQADPPTRVGRIAIIDGTVSFHPTPDDPWAPAAVNYPIAQAGQLWVEPNSRAEIGLGEARVRIDGGTEVDIVQFDDQNVVLSVPQGRADIYLRGRHPDEHYIVETPRGNVEIGDDGHYRVFAGDQNSPTRVAAFHGAASIAEPQANVTINRGEEAVIAPSDPPSFQVVAAAEDPFDHWGEERERRVVEGVSYRYVSADMPGAADLDQYGTWRDDPQYGHVWIPTSVQSGWAPYRHGHWASVAPWGWTWVDDAPWGFAPFHYGRWAEVGGTWAWVPGEVRPHPVYAPALVAWVGDPGALVGGGGVGVSVGWIPLGPREVWVPPYHVSVGYVRESNIAYVPPAVVNNITVNNITVIHNNTTFVNQRNVTVVSQQSFASAQPVQRNVVAVQPAAFTHPIVAAATPAKILPPPTPAAHIASPLHAAAAPPPPSVPLAHPITPTNNLPKLAPAAAHAGPVAPAAGAPHPGGPTPAPVPNAGAPHPGAPTPAPTPNAGVPHPGGPAPAPTPNVAAPHPGAPAPTPAPNAAAPHPGAPAPGAPGPHPVGPAPAGQSGGYHAPTAPEPHTATPAPQVHAPTPAPEAHPVAPAPQTHAPEPPHPAPAPQVHAPEPQHPAAPAPQFHPPAPAPQVHAPEPPHPAPQAPHPAPAPQVHAPEPPHPAPQAPHPAPAPQAAHPPAPAPQQQHPAAAPPKKDDKKDEHH